MKDKTIEFIKEFGAVVKRRRESLKIKQLPAAKLAGTSATTLSSIENGQTATNLRVIVQLSKVLGWQPWELLKYAAEPESADKVIFKSSNEEQDRRSSNAPIDPRAVFCSTLKYWREAMHLGLDDLAKAAKIDEHLLRQIEAGTKLPTRDTIQAISNALKMSDFMLFVPLSFSRVAEAPTTAQLKESAPELKATGGRKLKGLSGGADKSTLIGKIVRLIAHRECDDLEKALAMLDGLFAPVDDDQKLGKGF